MGLSFYQTEIWTRLPPEVSAALDAAARRVAAIGIRPDLPRWPLLAAIFLVGGAAWGATVDRLTRTGWTAGLAIASALAYAAVNMLVALNVTSLDRVLGAVGPEVPRLLALALVFGAVAAVVAGANGLTLGVAAGADAAALRVCGLGALAAAIASIAAIVVLDALDVGMGDPSDPGALQRVTTVAAAAAAGAYGAAIGIALERVSRRRRRPPVTRPGRAGVSRRR